MGYRFQIVLNADVTLNDEQYNELKNVTTLDTSSTFYVKDNDILDGNAAAYLHKESFIRITHLEDDVYNVLLVSTNKKTEPYKDLYTVLTPYFVESSTNVLITIGEGQWFEHNSGHSYYGMEPGGCITWQCNLTKRENIGTTELVTGLTKVLEMFKGDQNYDEIEDVFESVTN